MIEKGDIVYPEVGRENVRTLEAYVEEMATGGNVSTPSNIQTIQYDVLKLWNVVKSQLEISESPKYLKGLYDGVVRSLHKRPESGLRPGAPRTRRLSSQFLLDPKFLSTPRSPRIRSRSQGGHDLEIQPQSHFCLP